MRLLITRLTEEQRQRYSRHILLPQVGEEGQLKMLAARVLLVGAGGLGSSIGYYLAAAGVGTIGIIDDDVVELSNLQRQIAHKTEAVGKPKVFSAKDAFEALNPDVRVIPVKERLSGENILSLFKDYEIVCDCCDNFETRFLVNDVCVALKKPLVSGAVAQFEGQLVTVIPGQGPCYRCLFEAIPPKGLIPSSGETGIFGFIPGVIGALQASEVIKIIIGRNEILRGELLIYDALKQSFRKVKIPKNPECPACSG